jgi:3-oxoacyl-[acyl-carrier-protein] synthase II
MRAYINGIGLISPQKTADGSAFLAEITEHNSDYLKCIDPNYKAFIDPIAARRMSRLIKMGITSAKLCLADAGVSMPGAIITGTGLGSVEDTEKILTNLLHEEPILNPTPFIQSTYNTISSQIAINLKCHNYNSTYVHRTFSFESCLQDALMQLEEKSAENILVGGIDEMTMNHLTIIRRLGHWKMEPVSNLGLLNYLSKGALAGEGSGYFLVSSARNDNSYAMVSDIKTIYKPGGFEGIRDHITRYLSSMNLAPDDIDIFLTGLNGDQSSDQIYYRLSESLFPEKPLAWFKHLCGEYHTASAFALWVAANCIKNQVFPGIIAVRDRKPDKIRNILIYNQLNGINHSLMLVSVAE